MKYWFKNATQIGLTVRHILILESLSIVSLISETIGIAIFLPIFQFMRMDGNLDILVENSRMWQFAVDFLSNYNVEITYKFLLILALLFLLSKQFFNFIKVVFVSKITQELAKNFRDRMFDGFLSTNTNYQEKIHTGNMVNSMTTETASAIIGIMAPLELLVLFSTLIVFMGILSALSFEMTMLSIAVLTVTSFIPRKWISLSADAGREWTNSNRATSSFLINALRSARLIKLSGTVDAETKQYKNLTNNQRNYAVLGAILKAKTDVTIEPIVVSLSLLLLYLSFTHFNLSLEMIGLYLIISIRLIPIVKSIVSHWQRYNKFKGSIENILDRINKINNNNENANKGVDILDINSISLKNISYKYPGSDNYVLRDITFDIPLHSIVAIVGPSGSGKSTLIDLIPRVRVQQRGVIEINGLNTEVYSLSSLRELVSYAAQDPQIFSGSILQHIKYGKPNATISEVKRAADLSGAGKFIEKLQDKYKSSLDEDGANLSGGQLQRIDLSRAIIKESPILILDEPTSNLDVESENLFSDSLINIVKQTNKTILIVTHSLLYSFHADKIIVINNGVMEAEGSHERLLETSSWYKSTWDKQISKSHTLK
jgi:ABC-type multidrug transport system fused ATPase/permease subunit